MTGKLRGCVLGVVIAVASPAGAMTADELIAKNLEARGGVERIKAVDAMRSGGRMVFAQGDSTFQK